MSETDTPKDQEISLDDIDALLEQEDPDFSKSMAEVRAVESDKNVAIEASADVEGPGEVPNDKPDSFFGRLKFRVKTATRAFIARRKLWAANFGAASLVFLKTKPKACALATVAGIKVGVTAAKTPLAAFARANRATKLTMVALLVMVVGALTLLLANFKGVWLPPLEPPILKNLSEVASEVETFDVKEKGESFNRAFPQERNDFLFPKMKVNLRRTPENPVPMGAFELVAEVDSKDTAIELRDREVELSDLLQRIFEEQSFNDLASELGKQKLKSQIKRELDTKLTQGFIRDVEFKTFILKP